MYAGDWNRATTYIVDSKNSVTCYGSYTWQRLSWNTVQACINILPSCVCAWPSCRAPTPVVLWMDYPVSAAGPNYSTAKETLTCSDLSSKPVQHHTSAKAIGCWQLQESGLQERRSGTSKKQDLFLLRMAQVTQEAASSAPTSAQQCNYAKERR
jgi:hypothetical protein